MTGLRLEVEMYLVSVQGTAAQNLRKSVERAGYRVADLVLEPLAGALAVLTEEEKELGCALVELGGGSTSVAIFQDGKIRHLASLRYAGGHVTSDIVQGLGVSGGAFAGGLVLRGGGGRRPGVVELAREGFAWPARAGLPGRGITGLVDSVQAPRYAVPVGVGLYAARA